MNWTNENPIKNETNFPHNLLISIVIGLNNKESEMNNKNVDDKELKPKVLDISERLDRLSNHISLLDNYSWIIRVMIFLFIIGVTYEFYSIWSNKTIQIPIIFYIFSSIFLIYSIFFSMLLGKLSDSLFSILGYLKKLSNKN